MEKTSRGRNILRAAAAGGVAAGLGIVLRPEAAEPAGGGIQDHEEGHGQGHRAISGPLSSATVSFGQWRTDPPVSRFPNVSPAALNHHLITPNETTIQAGGAVNFIISGFHQVVIYDHGTRPFEINTTLLIPTTGPPGAILINDPNKRIYFGLDPSLQLRDRSEVVTFSKAGIYLVICGLLAHFQEGMVAHIKVLP